jgi:hypothetical protein
VTVLPDAHILTPLKLAIGTWGMLVLPGAVILRLLGWPRSLAAALPACAVWSVTALAPGFMLMLLVGRGLFVAILWLLAVIAVGLVLGRGTPVEVEFRLSWALLFLGSMAGLALLLWLGSWNNVGDAVEHIARMRKITDLSPPAHHLDQLGLLPPGTGLHPGYAFPLWHATGAVIVWITGLEETTMFRFWPAALVPFVALAIYRAGRSMFGCREAGIATFIAYLGLFAFPAGVYYFSLISYPGNISIFLFWPLVIDRLFTYLREGGREPLWTIAAAAFAVSAIHGSYAPFMILLVGLFFITRLVIVRDRSELRRMGLAFGFLTVPFLLFLIWLFPAADSSASTVSRAGEHFFTIVNRNGSLVSMKADWLTRGGPLAVAALLCVPLASSAMRTRAAAFVASTSAAVILILLVPQIFTPFAHVLSVSQGRRFIFYLPWAFALVGGALILARFRWYAVAAAFLVGLWLHRVWPGDFHYTLHDPGPGWVAWVAAAGAIVAIVLGALGKLDFRYRNTWALPIVAAFTIPVAVPGIYHMKIDRPEPDRINDHLIAAVNKYVTSDDVVLGPPKSAYRLSAQAPVYIVAAAGGHGGDTVKNQHPLRRLEAKEFFDPGTSFTRDQAIIDHWGADWVIVRKDIAYPRAFLSRFTPVYDDKNWALYPVDATTIARVKALQGEPSSS